MTAFEIFTGQLPWERSLSSEETLRSLYYDAFLYPENVSTPGARCHVRLSDSTELPSGFMRFSPMSSSALFDEDAGI